jgi:hypothetical protein
MSTLKKVAVTLDRLTVLNSEYHSLTTQTSLLLNSLEKAHSLVQSGLNNIIDVARLPLEVVNGVLSNHIKVSLQSASSEFTYSDTGYNLQYRIPRLSEPFKMYSIKSLPVYSKGVWMTLNHKEIYIANSVSDTLEIGEVEKKCYSTHTYYICYPEEVEIYHSVPSCELQLIEYYWGNPTDLSLCQVDHIVVKPVLQKSLMVTEGLTISSSFSDNLTYICDNSTRDRVKEVPVGVTLFKYKKDCIYETSMLTVYNSVKSNVLLSNFSEGADREIDLIGTFTEIQTQLDDFMSM